MNIVVEHRIENLTTCVYSLIYFYLIEKSYPQTREIGNFGKILPIIPQMKKPDFHPWMKHMIYDLLVINY